MSEETEISPRFNKNLKIKGKALASRIYIIHFHFRMMFTKIS